MPAVGVLTADKTGAMQVPRYGFILYVKNHPFYGHGLIAIGQRTYRCSVLRQAGNELPSFDLSVHRPLRTSFKINNVFSIKIVINLIP